MNVNNYRIVNDIRGRTMNIDKAFINTRVSINNFDNKMGAIV